MTVTDTSPGKKIWETCVLASILVVAACVRFYALDQNGLSASELSSIALCDVQGWVAMVNQFAGNSGMPPLYPTLLCQITALTSDADFFVRALSAMAGVGLVYATYLLGKEFLSPLTGMLAAVLVATDFQTIVINRDTALYSLFAFFCVLHSYFFCKLILDLDKEPRPIEIGTAGQRFNIVWKWIPAFPCDARMLLGFWISGVLAFYTSPVALLFFMVEWLASCLFIEKNMRRQMLQSMWAPVFIALLPWMPVLYDLGKWALKGNLFGVQTVQEILQKTGFLLPGNPAILTVQVILLGISLLAISGFCFWRCYELKQRRFLGFVGMYIVLAPLALGFIKAMEFHSLLYSTCFLAIAMAEPTSFCIRKIPFPWLRNTFVTLAVVVIVVYLTSANVKQKIYLRGGDNGFNQVAKIISADVEFMRGNRKVFISTDLFDHYLHRYGITSQNNILSGKDNPVPIRKAIDTEHFYVLEYRGQDKDFEQDAPAFATSVEQYTVSCTTRIPRFRIARFSISAAMADRQPGDCREFLSIKGSSL
jgi:4-amino-4-deoxy-L-arabinose transferase-like glycosyltransferase